MPKRASSTSFGAESGNRQGRGPARGSPNAGPRTKSFKLFLASLRTSATTQAAIKTALSDPESKGFNAALRVLSEYDEDKPAEKREMSGKLEVSVRMSREGSRRTAG